MTPEQKSPDACWDEALDWLLKINANPGDRSLQARLDAWLQADARHAAALAEARSVWAVSGQLPADEECHPPVARRASRRRHDFALAIAAALVLAVLGPHLCVWFLADAVTGTAEMQNVSLRDGSQVALAPRSALSIDEASNDARGVELLRGEAYFEIAHDPGRPFIVRADDVRIRVLGTGFDVLRTADDVVVAVKHGRVRVELNDPTNAHAELSSGQQARIRLSDGRLTQSVVSSDAVGGWQQGRLEFSDATLDELADVLDRYHAGIIHIGDASLAQASIAGVYRTDDPQTALQVAAGLHGARVRQLTPWLLWIERND